MRQLTVRPQRLSPPLATEQDGGHPVRTYSETAFGGISADGCATYAYDGFDRMTSMTASGCGLSSATYTYDALDRMHTSTAGTVTHTFHYDGWNTTATTVVPSSGSTTTYEVSPSDQPLGVTQASTSHNLFSDGHGNVSTAVTTSGGVACTARFDPFGNPLNVAGTVTPGTQQPDCNTGSTPDTVFYRNARHDSSSGDYPLGPRLYDPQKDSFLTQDGYRSGQPAANPNAGNDPLLLNTYTYVNGDPVNLSDPTGHRYTTGIDYFDANSGTFCQTCYTYPTHYTTGTSQSEIHRDRAHAVLHDEFVTLQWSWLMAEEQWRQERAAFVADREAPWQPPGPFNNTQYRDCQYVDNNGTVRCPDANGRYTLTPEQYVPHANIDWGSVGINTLITVGTLAIQEIPGVDVAADSALVARIGSESAEVAAEGAINTGDVAVYISTDAADYVDYVGITNNIERRAAEQLGGKGIEINPIAGLENLSRLDARSVEQVLIEEYGGPRGGQLLNQINSIATSNPIYAQSIKRGCALLAAVGYAAPGVCG